MRTIFGMMSFKLLPTNFRIHTRPTNTKSLKIGFLNLFLDLVIPQGVLVTVSNEISCFDYRPKIRGSHGKVPMILGDRDLGFLFDFLDLHVVLDPELLSPMVLDLLLNLWLGERVVSPVKSLSRNGCLNLFEGRGVLTEDIHRSIPLQVCLGLLVLDLLRLTGVL